MPENKIKVELGGREVDATRVHIISSEEAFNTYILEDGTTIRMKSVVTDVLRVDNEKDAAGNPVYMIKSQNVTDIRQGNS